MGMGEPWSTAANIFSGFIGLIVVIIGFTVRRELHHHDSDRDELRAHVKSLSESMTEHVNKTEFDRLKVEADMRFRELDRDIKNTGESLQRVIREELAGVTKRLDTIMLALNTRRQGE
jgi:hypothetical protein